MRTYGRIIPNPLYPNKKQWIVITTDAQGFNDAVMLTTLAQTFKLNLGESPFFGDYGIPAHPSIVTQVSPDYYVSRIQQQFMPYFISLSITRGQNTYDENNAPVPSYKAFVLSHYGSSIEYVAYGQPNTVL